METYQNVKQSRDGDRTVPAEIRIGDESAEQRQHLDESCPRVDPSSGRRRRLAELAGEVGDQVQRYAVVRRPLRYLHP